MKDMGTGLRADDLIATYSSKGPSMLDDVVKPDLVAPGNLIMSTLASTSDTMYSQYPAMVAVSDYTTVEDFVRILHAERHQHGGAGGKRRGSPGAAAEPRAHP